MLQYCMTNDNSLNVLQQFLIEQSAANDMMEKAISARSDAQRHMHLLEYSKMLIRYMEIRHKYE